MIQTIGSICFATLLSLKAPVATWDEGVPLGNGGAGALLWGGGDTLNITLDRADFWHNADVWTFSSPDFSWEFLVRSIKENNAKRRKEVFEKNRSRKKTPEDSTKLPGVRLVMKLGKGHTLKNFSLHRENAVATVTVSTPAGDKKILAWFDDGDTHLSLQVPKGVEIIEKNFLNNKAFDSLGGYPASVVSTNRNVLSYYRGKRKGANGHYDKDFISGVRFRDEADRADSKFWRKFNAKSSISIPDKDMQRLYDMAIYLYGAAARKDCAPIALQGIWSADNGALPPWRGDYHNDLNTQMTYWAAGPSGCIEALEAFADFYIACLPEFKRCCEKLFAGRKGAVIPGTMGYSGKYMFGWTGYSVPPTGGIWAFITFCDAWDYEPTIEKARKLLDFGRLLAKGLEYSWEEKNGIRNFAVSCSPEYMDNKPQSFLPSNSSYDRAIAKSFYLWLARLEKACGNEKAAADMLREAQMFGPASVTNDGVLQIAKGIDLKTSHRHPSHLLQIFPLTNVPSENSVNDAASVDYWEKLGTSWWCGYSFSWAGCFEARLGRGDRAYRYLKDFQRAFVTRNGFHVNGDQLKIGLSRFLYRPFTLEGNFGYARGIQEMLLRYDIEKNEYHLFPALPKAWDGKEVSFCDLRIPGGHRISARRAADGTVTHTFVPYPGSKNLPALAIKK
jgi:alpha-L-fucosidase 2